MNEFIPFPLEEKINKYLGKKIIPEGWRPTNLDKKVYLKIAKPIVKEAIFWQNKYGRIIDPFEKKETPTTTSRFVGALSFLIDLGENSNLIDICVKSMNTACKDLYLSLIHI